MLTLLGLASRLSLFFTIPWFIHSLFPAVWAKTVQLILSLFGIGFLIASFFHIMPPVAFTIGIYSILIALGGYALIHGFISSLHIPRDQFHGSRELYYSLVALVSFLVSLPFMFPGDLTMIPKGDLGSQFYFFPYHSLITISGFFVVSIKPKGHWI
ncbi:MAG: hypothetical protein JXB03_04820, partial [Spirochaetales bacterium]|nr:hypothetical protein [Spirochaetales bacterium]